MALFPHLSVHEVYDTISDQSGVEDKLPSSLIMARLPIETRGRVIGMIQAGQSFTVVSRLLCCAVSTVQRLWQKFTQTDYDSILGGKSFKK